ncbi:MAG: hybrid sensor histidine kinase/response regulator [Planctomycetaceae bacterium]|nr:hybrid sensor histidine kinase/response regulator [Planctomycetaceae bacterium]
MSDLGGFSLHELFKGEAEMHAAALSDGLVRLEGTSDPATVEPLMRAAHSIKGAARVIGLDIAVRLAHAMEDSLVAMQKGREPIVAVRIDQLLKGTDLLAALARVEEAEVPSWSAANDAAVSAIVEALRAAPPTGAVAPSSAPASPSASSSASPPAAAPPDSASVGAAAPGITENAPDASGVEPEEQAPSDTASPATTVPVAPAAAAPPATIASAATPATPSSRASAVRVSAEKLDRLLQLAGETMLESRRLSAVRAEATEIKQDLARLEDELDLLRTELRRAGRDPAAIAPARGILERSRGRVLAHLLTVEGAIRRGEETSTQLYHEVLSSRMRPFADATGALPRTVRDLTRALGKDARLEVVGESVPVDRDILARLDAPLNHMLRNAIDHGIETPEERRAAGKPPQATLRVEARHHAGQLRIRVSDDGRGIDLEALRARIVRKQLASSDMAAGLDCQELLEFLFLPGFSTAQKVTEYSGRGVGLDVVQSTAREIGGVARIHTELGKGTVFELELPITLSVIRALLVEVCGETLAFPLARIDRVVQPERDAIATVAGRMQFLLDDVKLGYADAGAATSIGIVEAGRVLALGEPRADAARANIVVLGSGEERYGFAVDALVGEEDLVVRALDARLGKVPHLSAAAVRESGEPVLIVDTEDILQSVRMALNEGRIRGARPALDDGSRRVLRALVVDDSATVREVERQLLVRMGFSVETAVDGLDGWHQLRDGAFDLVVSDIDMPRMNGIEFVRTLRADGRFASLPVIVVSYKDREEDRLAGLEAGATAYLTKGAFQDSTFADTVRDLVDPSRGAGGRA